MVCQPSRAGPRMHWRFGWAQGLHSGPRMRFATRSLRTSVVRVVAAFAPLAGCSDSHEPMSEHTINPPAPPCWESSSGCVPAVTENPPPPVLDATTPPPVPYHYDANPPSIDPTKPVSLFRDAGWDSGPVPEPPADANVSTTCPAQEPATGSACDVPPAFGCSYGPLCDSRPTHQAECVQGKWQIYVSTCNPPPIPCPANAPTEGASCERGFGPPRCSYGTCDGGVAAASFECTASRWSVIERCGVPACPTDTPVSGAWCSYAGPACGYGHCSGAPTVYASCTQGAWSLQRVSCNPPPPDTCPALAPAEGSSCSHNGGNTCVFSLSVGGQVLGDCVNGRWQLRAPDAGS